MSDVDYKEVMASHTDQKLVEIISLREYYQPQAANAAITEAIRRNIIDVQIDINSQVQKKIIAEPYEDSEFEEIESGSRVENLLFRFFRLLMNIFGL